MKRITFDAPEDLRKKLKVYLAEHDLTAKELLVSYLENLLNEEKK